MFDITTIPEHIREWAEKDLLPELERLRTSAETHAQLVLAQAQRYLKFVQAFAATAGPEAQALVAAAEAGVAEAEAFLQKVSGKTP